MRHDKTGKVFDQLGGSSRSKVDARNETILTAERKLVHVMALILGFAWFLTICFQLETKWYSIGLLIAFVAFCIAIVVRWIGELKRGEI